MFRVEESGKGAIPRVATLTVLEGNQAVAAKASHLLDQLGLYGPQVLILTVELDFDWSEISGALDGFRFRQEDPVRLGPQHSESWDGHAGFSRSRIMINSSRPPENIVGKFAVAAAAKGHPSGRRRLAQPRS